jgi:hypothetical protein
MSEEDDKKAKAEELYKWMKAQEESAERKRDIAYEELKDMELAKSLGIERLEIAEKEIDLRSKELALAQELNKAAYKKGEYDKEKYKSAKDQYEQTQKQLLLEERKNEAQLEGVKGAESAAIRFLGLTKDGGKMFDNWADKADGFGKKMKELLTVKNLAAAGITKVVEATVALAIEQDAAAVAFNKATGQAGAYNAQIAGLERSMFNAGVTSADAGQAFADLFTTVTDFSNMSESTQMDLAKTTALLNELGVSSSESAQSIQFLTKVMGQSTGQAAAQTREIFAFAQELGVSAAGMSADFIKMQPQIAALGDTGVQAFKDLQAQAKATGMSFDSLLSITAKFDTFAGAAEQVGKLNAIMGGPFLNTLEMVATTDPAERMRKLSEGIGAAGLSFDSMSYYQKKAMTSAAGLNSEMELAMLMSGKLETARGPVKTQADFEKLADQTAEFTTVLDEMKQMGMSLAVSLAPVVGFIKGIVDGITAWAPAMKGVIAAMVTYIGYQKISLALSSAQALMESIKTKGFAAAIGAAAFLAATAGVLATAYSAATTPSSSGKGYAVGTSGAPGGLALVGERGPEMVSLPKGSQVAANGSAGFNRMSGAYQDGTGASSTDVAAPPAPQGPIVINLKIGNETIQQIVHDTDLSKTHHNGKKSVANDSLNKSVANKIAGAV